MHMSYEMGDTLQSKERLTPHHLASADPVSMNGTLRLKNINISGSKREKQLQPVQMTEAQFGEPQLKKPKIREIRNDDYSNGTLEKGVGISPLSQGDFTVSGIDSNHIYNISPPLPAGKGILINHKMIK